jgi:hypothetical protein
MEYVWRINILRDTIASAEVRKRGSNAIFSLPNLRAFDLQHLFEPWLAPYDADLSLKLTADCCKLFQLFISSSLPIHFLCNIS